MTIFEVFYQASLIGTFIVLVWYTFETARIRKITTEQRDLQLLPAMMLYIRGDKDQGDNQRLAIRNIGFGTATAVHIDLITFNVKRQEIVFKFKLADQNSTLVADEEREVEIEVHIDGKSNHHDRHKDFYTYFSPENLDKVTHFKKLKKIHNDTPETHDIIITFRDIYGQGYNTTVGFRGTGIIVIKAPERVKE